jgi:thiamine pyrophosphokinase
LRAVIFANGELNDKDRARALIKRGDLLIAADGGAHHCQALGLTPDLVVGDLDSLSNQDIADLRQAGAQIERYPMRKDATDLELAFFHAQDAGANEALVLGGLGRRWDQTLANLLLPVYHRLSGLVITFWDRGQWLYLVDDRREIKGSPGMRVSLIPLRGDAIGVTTNGLDYPLKDETLVFGATRGISNVMLGERAEVSLRQGALLCVVGGGE